MRNKTAYLPAVVFTLFPMLLLAQDNTSRLVPFSLSTSFEPGTLQQVVVELWDAPSDGRLLFSESYAGPDALTVDETGAISLLFGSLQVPPGLNPDDFPSGSSRYLDVTQAGAGRRAQQGRPDRKERREQRGPQGLRGRMASPLTSPCSIPRRRWETSSRAGLASSTTSAPTTPSSEAAPAISR